MYEHCFRNLGVNIWSRLRRCRIPMIGFSGETYHPLGVIDLRVTLEKEGRSKTVLMEFAIIKCHSLYNIIKGRTGMRSLGAMGYTIHSMIKFPTNQGVVTMETSREALQECKHLDRVQGSWKEGLLQIRCYLKKHGAERMQKKRSPSAMNIRPVFDDGNRFDNQLIYPLAKPVVHKRRPMASEGRLALKEKGFHWLKEGLIIQVQYPEWIANTIPIKLASGTWKVQVDYSSLNKVCAKDMYPLPIHIRMAEDDEEKTSFYTEEGVLADQRGRNMETYLEEIVIKSKSEMDLVQDVKETLRKLKRVNIKIDPTMSSFEVKEGRFLGHMVAEEGLRADPRRIHAIILSLTPGSPNQIQSLFLQLTAISKSISKLAELKHPIHETRTRMEKAKESGWINEAEEALRIIKRKLSKKEAEGQVVKKFFGQGEQVEETPDANNEGIFDLSKGFQENSTPTTRSWRLYLGRETIKEGSGVGIILISPEENMYSYVIRLKFKASNHAMDYEALLAGLAASANQGIKDLHVFIDSLTLVTQVPNHTSPKNLEPKSRSVDRTGNYKARIRQLGSIVRYQNKTISGRDKQQQERQSDKQGTKAKLNCNHKASGSN
ncbi:reverse transcriptase domain-containing protein [Tanacetum coccineum]